jgi:uncharacterized membrane protein YoaK (UPF0700 family)
MTPTPERSSASERALVPALLILTVSTGIVDAVSYLGLGHIFAANMTGNVVIMGFALAGAAGLSIARSTVALVAYLSGALLGGRFAKAMSSGPRHRSASSAFAAEAGLLLAAAAVAMGGLAVQPPHAARLYTVIVLMSLAMGIRNATVRSLGVPDLTTTVLTMTITGLAADSTLAGGTNPRWPRRVASIVAMIAGAALGVLLLRWSLAVPLVVCAFVAGACAVTAHVRGSSAANA